MTYLLIAAAQGFAMLDMLRRLPVISAAVLCGLYVSVMQLYFLYMAATFHGGQLTNGSLGSFYFRTETGIIIYAVVFGLIYLSTLGKRNIASMVVLRESLSSPMLETWIRSALWVSAAVVLIRYASVDTDILWHNNTYLLLNSDKGLAISNPITSLARPLFGLVGMLCGAIFALSLARGMYLRASVAGLLALSVILFNLAGASRGSVIPLVAAALVLMLFRGIGYKALAVFFAFLGTVLVVTALAGRAHGNFGLGSLPDQLSFAVKVAGTSKAFQVAIGSISQGIFVTSDSIYHGADFSSLYKILSFSPLPSSIDGFAAIRRFGQVRLSHFVPMSALGEAYNFGIGYAAFFAGFLMLCFRINAGMRTDRRPMAFAVSSLLIFATFVMANAYPMRNVFRVFLIGYLIMDYQRYWLPLRTLLVEVTRKNRYN